MISDRLEDDPRVPAPHVQNMGSDTHGVEDQSDLLQQMRQGQQRNCPVFLFGQDGVGHIQGSNEVGVGE